MPDSPSSPPVMPAGASATSFVIDFDLAALLARLGIECGAPDDQEAVLAAEQEALAASPEPPIEVPGRVAALLPTGAGLAAWLASADIGQSAEGELPDLALGYRRLATWAQAQELSAVAEIAARTAIRRERANSAGRPDQVLPEAGAEVALALTMSQPTAMDWTGLATRLRWQLPATRAALAAGRIDLARARIIAEATAPLSEHVAQAVEDRVLPAASEQTTSQLRAAVRRAVIAADPDGAERRRERAERCAKVCLYPDQDGTATLAGSALPAVTAAAAMARVTVIARAMKSAGYSGGLDYLRAYVMLGLLTGTLPCNPPAPGTLPSDPRAPGPPPSDPPAPGPPPSDPPAPGPPLDDPPAPGPPPDDRLGRPNFRRDGDGGCGDDAGADDDEAVDLSSGPVSWPPLPAALPCPVGTPALRSTSGRPPPGLLDVLLPWSALTARPEAEPAMLGRIGPVTPAQARQLLEAATRHPATEWRVILTDDHGRALAVERLRRSPSAALGLTRAGPTTGAPVIGRFTVTIPDSAISKPTPRGDKLAVALQHAARRSAVRAGAAAQADGRCSHHDASAAYRPASRLRELVVARDGTCTFPPCGQPAWRADLDHTIPWHLGGPTCHCNLSARCRTHHQIKQLTGWKLEQHQPGALRWTTPTGRVYAAEPHRYPI